MGCGHGRNAIYMSKKGCNIDALDISMQLNGLEKELK
ncbi:hypothetical protein [Gottfriedia sp. OAE603]